MGVGPMNLVITNDALYQLSYTSEPFMTLTASTRYIILSYSRWLRQEGIPCVPLCRDTDRAAIQIEPDISVQAFMVPHLGEEYQSVPHVCYLLTFDGRRVLFTADSDYLHEDFSRLADTPLYAVFLNPLFYQAYYNTRLFHGHFDTDTLCVYHVPFPEDDGMHMQDMARRMPRGAADSGLRVLPLTEPMQQIEL